MTDARGGRGRTDRSGPARVVASLVIVAFLGVVAVENFWYLPVLRRAEPRLRPVGALGLDQGWGMFVFRPDPSPGAQVLAARLTFADGTVRDHPLPQEDRFLGGQRAARWAKLGEFARPRSHGEGGGAGQELWRPLAEWLARTESVPGNAVVRVDLVARDRAIPELGDRRDPPWVESVAATFHFPA